MIATTAAADSVDSGRSMRLPATACDSLPGTFRVPDEMESRWKKRSDVCMGEDAARARRWGVRSIRIAW